MLDLRPGDDVNLTVRRNGRVQTLRLTLQARPAPDGKALARAKLGLDLRAITPTLARDLSLPVRNGLLVTGVAKASPAARVGIRPGDVLFQVGGFTVADFDALMPVLDDLPDGAPTTVGILRGNTAVLIRLRLAPKHSNPRSGP
jgi:S1-C subfamily serine protease